MFDDTFTTPDLDPELAPAVRIGESLLPPIGADNLAERRRISITELLGIAPPDLTVGGAVLVDELTVPGPDGAPDLALTVLRPAAGTGPWPVLYNLHGGGMIMGDRTTELPLYLSYVAEGLCSVVAVEYRLAPETPDPGPIEDCYAGLVWTATHGSHLGLDPDRIIVIGMSAGGGLAAGTALLARDRGFPALTHQILVCPMLDDRFETVSSRMPASSPTWDRNANLFGWTCLLGQRRGGPDVSVYAAPARAQDLTGLPPTFIDVGGVESFRDEAIGYGQRLAESGVAVDLHVWAGAFHAFDVVVPHAAVSQAAHWTRDNYIRRALST